MRWYPARAMYNSTEALLHASPAPGPQTMAASIDCNCIEMTFTRCKFPLHLIFLKTRSRRIEASSWLSLLSMCTVHSLKLFPYAQRCMAMSARKQKPRHHRTHASIPEFLHPLSPKSNMFCICFPLSLCYARVVA